MDWKRDVPLAWLVKGIRDCLVDTTQAINTLFADAFTDLAEVLGPFLVDFSAPFFSASKLRVIFWCLGLLSLFIREMVAPLVSDQAGTLLTIWAIGLNLLGAIDYVWYRIAILGAEGSDKDHTKGDQ